MLQVGKLFYASGGVNHVRSCLLFSFLKAQIVSRWVAANRFFLYTMNTINGRLRNCFFRRVSKAP